jgi:DNA-directed RNA polymerase specialized sigma24 family protein
MFPLLQRCVELHERCAWSDLFLLVEDTASLRVRWVLGRFGVSRTEVEDVVSELFTELYLDNCRKLRSCRAENEAEFRAWLWQVATHFAQNWVDRYQRAAARERGALSRLVLPDRSGPDDEALRARVEEWRRLMAVEDFERLLVLIAPVTAEPAVCERTRRHWTHELMAKYPHLLRGG